MYKNLLFLILFFFQISCGFNAVYKASDNKVLQFLSGIEVQPITTIQGTYFYNHLKTILPKTSDTKYILKVKLDFSIRYNVIQQNSDVLREETNINVNYELIDKASLKIITKGSFGKINSYNVNFSPYSNSILREDSENLLAQNAAEEIRNRLIMFFANK